MRNNGVLLKLPMVRTKIEKEKVFDFILAF